MGGGGGKKDKGNPPPYNQYADRGSFLIYFDYFKRPIKVKSQTVSILPSHVAMLSADTVYL